ncbi:sugar transferase [Tunturiibacter gelidoferens]|uniref:Exopolysaccharide biosynthesis polyprenyl glycosylphosphotransferase n=1 Tax=Tunturiibacter gelidiferens TaxID=3069689 RepID=A0A9X0QJW8_9BACT|nr:sugar transferase [Edaphobacter lichenicola]MBB5331670.1 exopolysaccharide biosynthesis polyprenyl glycosylphosphotransferase [Edaphobacter lichenicola]
MSLDHFVGPAQFVQEPVISNRPNATDRDGPVILTSLPVQSIPYFARVAVDLITIAIVGLIGLHIQTLSDLQMANGSIALAEIIHFHSILYVAYVTWFATCLIFFMQTAGLYVHTMSHSGMDEQRRTLQATLTAGFVLCGTAYLSHGEVISRQAILVFVLGAALMLSFRRALWRRMAYRRYREDIDTRNILIVGTGEVAQQLRTHLKSLKHLGFRFKGFVSLSEAEAKHYNSELIGDICDCLSLAKLHFVDEIFISVPAERELVIDLVQRAREVGIDVRIVPDLYTGLARKVPVEFVGQIPTLRLHCNELDFGSVLLKRALDLSLTSLALLMLMPLFLVIALAIRLDSPGPILYRSERIGRKGRTFTFYKFRTMVKNADALKATMEHRNERDSVLFKITDDPRVTRVGGILRKYSMDEIPQFLNVLFGDMSLVGPRPPLSAEVEKYELSHLRRLEVLPGMTGLWQVEGRQNPSFESYISLDTAYVENWSIWLDLKILLRTVNVVVQGTGT